MSRRSSEVLGSIDFTTVEVWTKGGLVTCQRAEVTLTAGLNTRRQPAEVFTTEAGKSKLLIEFGGAGWAKLSHAPGRPIDR